MLRVALVGAGRTVRMAHAPTLQALRGELQVVAVADPDATARNEIGVLLGLGPEHRYASHQEMLAREAVDVVQITAPHAVHHDAALDALKAGAHVITAPPLALTASAAREVLAQAETSGRQVFVLHFYLYYPPFLEAIRLVREGAIGHPFFVRCEGVTGGYGPGTEAYHPDWHNQPEVAGGGVWMDSGYHAVYIAGALMGMPVTTVAAKVGTYNTELAVDDTAAALLGYEQGGIGSIQVAWSVPSGGRRVLEVYGTGGTIAIDHEDHPLGVFDNTARTWHHPEIAFTSNASFGGCMKAIVESLRNGTPPPVSPQEALRTLETVLAGYRASEQGAVEQVGQ